jgi:hypothetical protein
MSKICVLTHEFVGGEEDDCDSVRIIAVHSGILVLHAMIPTEGFIALDADDWGVPEGMYPNPVERYVIRSFDQESGLPSDFTPAQFCRTQDLVNNGYHV